MPMTYRAHALAAAAAFVMALTAAPVRIHGETRPIDAAHSTMTVFVYKSGLFSAFADNHVISAPIAGGSISDEAPLGIELKIRAADLKVLDPGLDADKRADVQARMVGPAVLDAAKFPEIVFASTAVEPSGSERWQVTGRLTIRGQARTIAFPVASVNGRYRGEVTIKQRDFGIEPIKVAGGAVKVKDELKVQFDIAR
jgi:polyisoprenoid-binding protein YceI